MSVVLNGIRWDCFSLSEADARRSPLADSVLLMMNFGIDKMSLEIQSRGMYHKKKHF